MLSSSAVESSIHAQVIAVFFDVGGGEEIPGAVVTRPTPTDTSIHHPPVNHTYTYIIQDSLL
jgi:hypothetical protein